MTDVDDRPPPLAHQAEIVARTRDLATFGFWWDQGTGKTRPTLDTAAHLWRTGKIRGLLVLAPASVVRNWTLVEIPKHLPRDVTYRAHAWSAQRATTKKHARELEVVLGFTSGLAILAMSYDAMMTDAGKKAAWALLRSRPVLYVIDEAHRIKSPGAARTKRVLKSSVYAPYRRALTGTPVADTPFDVYTPVRFLVSDFWKQRSIPTLAAFRATFGRLAPIEVGSGRVVMKVVGYRNLDYLRQCLAEVGHRVEKADVLDLPPRTFEVRTFAMTPEQQRAYSDAEDATEQLVESGELETNPALAVTTLLRLQQITCGYYPKTAEPGEEPTLRHFEPNRRLGVLREVVAEALEEQPDRGVIVWCRFRPDIELVVAALDELGISWARIDGTVPEGQRPEQVRRFQAGEAQVFVGNPAAAGEGITLTRGTTVVRYSRSFSLQQQLQADDRNYRVGQDRQVRYVDLVAEGTVDEQIAETVSKKGELARIVTGDVLRELVRRKKLNAT